jgi:hypothetical protein
VLFQLLIPGITPVSLLESKSRLLIVTQLAYTGKRPYSRVRSICLASLVRADSKTHEIFFFLPCFGRRGPYAGAGSRDAGAVGLVGAVRRAVPLPVAHHGRGDAEVVRRAPALCADRTSQR